MAITGEAPDDAQIVFLGLEGETPKTIQPEDTWSPHDGQPYDGVHTYEVPTYSFGPPHGWQMRSSTIINGWNIVRPMVSQTFVDQSNARLKAKGLEPLYIKESEVPADLPDYGESHHYVRKFFDRLLRAAASK